MIAVETNFAEHQGPGSHRLLATAGWHQISFRQSRRGRSSGVMDEDKDASETTRDDADKWTFLEHREGTSTGQGSGVGAHAIGASRRGPFSSFPRASTDPLVPSQSASNDAVGSNTQSERVPRVERTTLRVVAPVENDSLPDEELSPSAPAKGASMSDQGSAELNALLENSILSNDNVLGSITKIARKAEALTSDQIQRMSDDQLDGSSLSGGTLEEKLALAEVLGTQLKYGLTPLNTVQGLVALRTALVDAYRDNHLVPVEVRLRAGQMLSDLAVIQAKQQMIVQEQQFRATIAAKAAETELELLRQKAKADTEIGEGLQKLRLLESSAAGATQKVAIKSKELTAEIDDKLLAEQKKNEWLAKRLDSIHERAATIRRGVVRPVRRAALRLLIPVIIVSNLVADAPGRETTAFLGTVDRTWDALYMPVRDGVLRTYNNVRSDVDKDASMESVRE